MVARTGIADVLLTLGASPERVGLRRVLLTALVALALALGASSPAHASGGDTAYWGVNLKGEFGDFYNLTYGEVARAAGCCFDRSRWVIRALFDKRKADLYANDPGHWNKAWLAYGGHLDWAYNSGITIIPVIGWTNSNGSWHKPQNSQEWWDLWGFSYQVINAMDWAASQRGMPGPNLVEAYNEPNCMSTVQECKFGGFPGGFPDYKANGFDPVAQGARNQDPTINRVVGGLGFGTTGSNGFEDAAAWIGFWEAAGYENDSEAYSVHPYGYTNPNTWVREATANQTAAKANAEFNRACDPSDDGIIVTETGRRTDIGLFGGTQAAAEQAQDQFLTNVRDLMHYNPGGSPAAAILNYLSISQTSTGPGSAGVIRPTTDPTSLGTAKAAWWGWHVHGLNGDQWMNDLAPNCVA